MAAATKKKANHTAAEPKRNSALEVELWHTLNQACRQCDRLADGPECSATLSGDAIGLYWALVTLRDTFAANLIPFEGMHEA